MNCPNCGQDYPAEASFCAACGLALTVKAETAESSLSSAPQRTLGYWASRGVAIAIGLVALRIFVDLFPNLVISLIPAALGACLWVGVKGKWPGTQRRVNPVVRALLSLVLIAANGAVALIVGGLFYIFGGGQDVGLFGIGLVVFVSAAAVEALAILLVVGAIKLITSLWRRTGFADRSSGIPARHHVARSPTTPLPARRRPGDSPLAGSTSN